MIMSTEKRDAVIAELQKGKTVTQISNALRVTYNSVYQLKRRLALSDGQDINKINPWTERQLNILKEKFDMLPVHFIHSQQFIDLCIEIGKSTHAVKSMIGRLNLHKKEVVIEVPVRNNCRPKAIYTNIQTPYAIATELHAGNRSYQKQCFYGQKND